MVKNFLLFMLIGFTAMIFFVSNVQAGSGANYSAYGFASDFNPQANYASNAIDVNEEMVVSMSNVFPISSSFTLGNTGKKHNKKYIRRQESKRGKRQESKRGKRRR